MLTARMRRNASTLLRFTTATTRKPLHPAVAPLRLAGIIAPNGCRRTSYIFNIDGLNMDAIYKGLVCLIAGNTLQAASGESIRESVARNVKEKYLEK